MLQQNEAGKSFFLQNMSKSLIIFLEAETYDNIDTNDYN